MVRSLWSLVYLLFYLGLGFVLLFLNHDLSKAIITLMNLILLLTPLIATIFGVMYYYNSREFTELLLAQPIRRRSIFIGQYLGVAASLSLSLILGIGIPFVIYGIFTSAAIFHFIVLLIVGVFLNFIFVALAFLVSLHYENRIKGFGYAILLWLFMAVIYDGLFLIALMVFEAYPLDRFSLIATLFNPIDLSRILILLELDMSALMGYTGALFRSYFGRASGMLISFGVLLAWVLLPVFKIIHSASRKDF